MSLAEHLHHLSASYPESLQEVFDPAAVTYSVEIEVDARDTPCPMPLLKAKQALRNLQSSQRLRVIATDSGSVKDFVSFAKIARHRITHFYVDNIFFYYVLQKGSAE